MPRTIKPGKPGLPVIKSLKTIKPIRPLPVAKPSAAPMPKRAMRPPLMKR